MASIQKLPGSKNWGLVWWQDGKQRWRTTGTDDRALAEKALEELRAVLAGTRREGKIRDILELASRVPVASARIPMASVWSVYEKQPATREIKARTARLKELRVESFIKWLTEKHPEAIAVQDVSERVALEYMVSLDGKAGQTRNNILSDLRSVWDVIRIPLGLDRNPWAAVKRVEARSIRQKAFTLDQVRQIMQKAIVWAAEGRGEGNFWPAAIALGYHTGLRWGDVCTLAWEEIDFSRKVLVVYPNKDRIKKKPVVHPFQEEFSGYLLACRK